MLAEGDSWFNYPIILTDIIDRISMEKDLAVYSIASGGDWFLNMIAGREYVEELSISHPDWFLISGGGNDLVGERRFAKDDYFEGLHFLSKKFYPLLMFFHLQYYFLLKVILKGGDNSNPKFGDIKIITQGYDYPLPSFKKRFGLNPITWYVPFVRKFLGHGSWLSPTFSVHKNRQNICRVHQTN